MPHEVGSRVTRIDSPVIDLITRRALDGSVPGQRKDHYRLGLAVEGGAMRGVVTAGMVTGLEMLGLRDAFDVVYGSSGGASNGAYFVAGQAAYGTTIYYDHINCRAFINLWRPLRNKPVVDFHFVTEDVMVESVVLDWKAVVDSPIPLKVLASCVESGDIEILEDFHSQQELMQALHASAHIPLVSGRNPYRYRGKLLWDSGIVDPLAIRSALSDHCTHLLALRSRPRGLPPRHLTLFERTVIAGHIARWSKTLERRFRSRFDPQQNGLAELERSQQCPGSQPYLLGITIPPTAPNISRLEKRRDRLVLGATTGVQAIFSAFGLAVPQVVESLTAIGQRGQVARPMERKSIAEES